jgi:hypothetical protein
VWKNPHHLIPTQLAGNNHDYPNGLFQYAIRKMKKERAKRPKKKRF